MNILEKHFAANRLPLLLPLACLGMLPCGCGPAKPAPSAVATPSPTAAATSSPSAYSTPSTDEAAIRKFKEVLGLGDVKGVTISTGHGVSNIDFKKIMDDLAANGKMATLRSDVTKGLGLTKDGEILSLREDVFRDESGALHYIATVDRDGGYLICMATKEIAYDFRLDKDRVLVAAVSSSPEHGLTVIPEKEARERLFVEWQYWAAIAKFLSN
jgi:hypothetical protein